MEEVDLKKIDEIANGVSELRDLFVRRLLDDKVKNNAIEKLSATNKDLIKVFGETQNDSIFTELFLLCDRIEKYAKEDDFVLSILDELIEIMARRGVERIKSLDFFDPNLHNIVSIVEATEENPAGSIVEIRRNGYKRMDRILRTTDVVVAK